MFLFAHSFIYIQYIDIIGMAFAVVDLTGWLYVSLLATKITV